jgi:biotin operon repressor
MNVTVDAQAVKLVKFLVAILAEPRIRAQALAKTLGVSEAWVNQMTMKFREAGIEIEYDREVGQYSVTFSKRLQSKLSQFVAEMKRTLEGTVTEVLVSEKDRYTTKEFGQMIGTTNFNVYNMITGYKGARLPAGWCAYRLSDRGQYRIQKMVKDAKGNLVPPKSAINAVSIVIGSGEIPKTTKAALQKGRCIVNGCGKNSFSRNFCYDHYFQARRNPDRFPNPNDGLPWPPKGIADKLKKKQK